MFDRAIHRVGLGALTLAVATASCGGDQADPSEFTDMAVTASPLVASPTNSVADDPAAAALGQKLFFDHGFSADGTVACVSCHDPEHGFSDARARSVGVRGQLGDRHAMPVTAAVLHPYLLWDGKADSAWSQPLKALENPKEMDFTRVEVARRLLGSYGSDYQTVFGNPPDLSATPARAKPGDDSWGLMTDAQRDEVQRVFANAGKALEAYERKLLCTNTRFDLWVRGEGQLTDAERTGAATFQRQGCTRCHSGPSFSDGQFHDIGIPSTDRGRVLGAPALLADPFNGVGPYSDDRTAGAARLASVAAETGQEGAFRTASLRGAGQRTFFGHASHEQTLRGFILDVYRRGGRRGRGATVGTVDPKLDGVNVDDGEADEIIAFLRTLDCPAPPSALLAGQSVP
ncbi:MAG: Di-hem cytochrome c peroxidase [Labilithrix sp.]|nr:Di-hem cytochrome c peroxidase [Labilithrix sp.]